MFRTWKSFVDFSLSRVTGSWKERASCFGVRRVKQAFGWYTKSEQGSMAPRYMACVNACTLHACVGKGVDNSLCLCCHRCLRRRVRKVRISSRGNLALLKTPISKFRRFTHPLCVCPPPPSQGRYFSKPSAHDKRDVAIVTTGTTAAAAANIYDEEKGDEGYDQEENGQDFVDAGAGGDADVPSTVDGKGEAVTAGTTAAAAATAAVGGDDGGDDVKHEGSDVLQPPPAEEEDDGQKEETAAVVPAEEPEQVVAEPEPAAETEQVEAEPEPEPSAEPEPAAEPEPEPAASPAEATATAVAEGDKELSADGEEAAPATDGAETTVVAAPASAAVESEGDGGGGSEEGGPSAAAAATPGVDKE